MFDKKIIKFRSVDINNYHSLKKSKLDPILNSSKNNNYYLNNHLNADGVKLSNLE